MPRYVYVMTHGFCDSVKIGHSSDPRMRELAANLFCPIEGYKIAYRLETDNAPSVEKYVHKRLSKFRQNGEWFNVTLEVAVTRILEGDVNVRKMFGAQSLSELNLSKYQ